MRLNEIVTVGFTLVALSIPRAVDDPSIVSNHLINSYNVTQFSSKHSIDLQLRAINSKTRPYGMKASFVIEENNKNPRLAYMGVQERKNGPECDALGLKPKNQCPYEIIIRSGQILKSMREDINKLMHNLYKRPSNSKRIN